MISKVYLSISGKIYRISTDFANNIITDSLTLTQLYTRQASGNQVTDIRTTSILGANALNSFKYFNVATGNTVNLYVPDGVTNLINLVSGGKTTIDGVLNSIQGGKIGGNVFILNPYGMIVGSTGKINVGALSVSTPLQSVFGGLDKTFESVATSISMVTDISSFNDWSTNLGNLGTEIGVQGTINALHGIQLSAGKISVSGKLISGAVFSGSDKTNFRDVINTYGVNSPLTDNAYISDDSVKLSGQKSITVNAGAVLLSKKGSIDVTSNDTSEWVLLGIAVPTSSTSIEIDDAILQGKNINISATAKSTSLMNPVNGDTTYSLGLKTLNDVAGITPIGKMDSLIRELTGMVVFQKADAKATVVVGDKAKLIATGKAQGLGADGKVVDIVNGGDIDITSNAETMIKVTNKSIIAGAVVGLSNVEASTTVKKGATLAASQNIDVLADTSNTMIFTTTVGSLSADSDNKINQIVPVNLGVSYVDATSVTNAVIESGAVAKAQAGSANVVASNSKEFSNGMSTAGSTDVLGAAVAISTSETINKALIAGSVTAGKDVTVQSTLATVSNITTAASSVGGDGATFTDTEVGKKITEGLESKSGAKKFSDGLNEKIFGKVEAGSPSFAQKLGVNAAVAVALHTNDATAAITSTGSEVTTGSTVNNAVKAGEKVIVGVDEKAVVRWGAVATQSALDPKKAGISKEQPKDITAAAAIIYAKNINKANAYIGDNAIVDAKKSLSVTSTITLPLPNPALDMLGYVKDSEGYDQKLYFIVDFAKTSISENLGANGYFTSWAQSSADGETAALAASVNIRNFENTNTAYIGKSAKINQDKEFLGNAAPIVTVSALNDITSLDLAGDFKFPVTNMKLWEGKSWQNMYGSTAGKAGVGGAVLVSLYDNTAKAYIDESSAVYANILNVTADNSMKNISIAATGGKAGSLGIDASVSVNQITNTTYAQINKGALITTVGITPTLADDDTKPIGASGDVVVKATDKTIDVNIVSGISSSNGVSIGAAVSYNNITRDTQASVSGNLVASGSLVAEGKNDGTIVSGSLSLALSKDVPPPETPKTGSSSTSADTTSTSDPLASVASIASGVKIDTKAVTDPLKSVSSDIPQVDQAGAKSGVSISGNVAINTIKDTTLAYIADGANIKAKTTKLSSITDGDIYAVSAAAAVATNSGGSGSVGIAGAAMVNNVSATTQSYIDNATLVLSGGDTAGNSLEVAAENGTGVISISLSAAGTTKGAGVAGQVSVNMIDNDTSAYLTNVDLAVAKDTTITALDDVALVTVAGSAAYGGNAGVGASIAVNLMENVNEAYIKDSHVVGTTVDSDLTVKASETSKIVSVAAAVGASKDQMAAAISASGNSLKNSTNAYIEGMKDGSGGVDTLGNVTVSAIDKANVTSIAGSAALAAGSNGAGVGASVSVLATNNEANAYIADDTTLKAKDLTVSAQSAEKAVTIAAGGAGGGTAGIAGSASVNVLKQKSDAHVGKTAVITASRNLSIKAANSTSVTGLAGALAIGKTAGIGVASDVEIITNNTAAYVDTGATVAATGNIGVEASSTEDIMSFAGGIAGGGDVGIAGSANVHVVNTTTQAFIGRASDRVDTKASAKADGSVAVMAIDDSKLTIVAGSGAYGGSAGIGMAAAVDIVTKTTEAYLGDHAIVEGKGHGTGMTVQNGTFDISYVAYSADDIAAPTLSTNGNGDIDNEGVSKKREVEATTSTLKGVAVTAVAKNNIKTLAVGAGVSGTAALTGSAAVNVVNNTTIARLGTGSSVNSGSGASTEQSVIVAAGSDYSHLGIGGALSVGGSVGIGAAVDNSVLTNTTKAYIDKGAQAKAVKDVSVKALSSQDIISVGAAIGASGTVGVAGAVTVNVMNNHTLAYIGNTANVTAGNNVVVTSKDKTEIVAVAGGVGIGGGAAGVGGSVHVANLIKDTQAYIDSGAVVDANAGRTDAKVSVYNGEYDSNENRITKSINGISLEAQSSEKLTDVVASGGLGLYAGVSGSVAVNIDKSSTKAFINDNAKINNNNTNANTTQSISIAAVNDVKMLSVSGAAGGGMVGVAGGVDVGIVKNDTSAYIGNGANVKAKGGLDLNTLTTKDISSYASSISGGLVGVAGSVSVYGIGTNLSTDATTSLQATKDSSSSNNPKEDNVGQYADGQMQTTRYSDLLGTYDDQNIQNAGTQLHDKTNGLGISSDISNTTVVPGGTTAFAGNATLTIDGKLTIKAQDKLVFSNKVGAISGGLGALGGAVGIVSVTNNTDAHIATGASVTAGSVAINADLNETFTSGVLAGGAGMVGAAGAVSVVNDNSNAKAYVGTVKTMSAKSLAIASKAAHTVTGNVLGSSAGLLALTGAVLTATVDGSNQAYLGGVVTTDGNITVQADTVSTLTGTVIAPSVGTYAGGAAVTTLTDKSTTKAYVTGGTFSTAGNLTIESTYTPVLKANSVGVGVGGIAVGVAVAKAEASGQSEATVGNNSSMSGTNIEINASTKDDVYAETTAGAGGVAAVGGSKATATDNVATRAYSGSNVNMTTSQGVTIAATAAPKAKAEAKGYSFGGLSVGVSVAKATVNPNVDAHIGMGNRVNSKNVTVFANLERPDTGDSVYANAIASGGGLIGVNATQSYADETSVVTSYISNNSQLAVAGDLNITADANSNQMANSSAKTGGIIAVGANTSEATADSTTIAYLGTGAIVTGGTASTLSVIANGTEDTLAEATSGTGGVIAGSAAKAKTKSISNTTAYIGVAKDTTSVTVSALNLAAQHTGTVNSHVDSLSASVAGGSGATAQNTENATVTTTLNGTINTKNLLVKAVNNILKPVSEDKGYNVKAGTGGLLNGAAAREDTSFTGSTLITIGDGSNIKVTGDKKNPGDTIFEALTNVDGHSSARLVAGGAIAIAKAEANMTTDIGTGVAMGKGVTIDSVGDVTLAAYTTADVEASAGVNVWGLAGAAQGSTSSTLNASNTVGIDANSLIRVDGNINLYAGRSSGGETNVYTVKGNTDLYNNTVIPMNGTPRADVSLNQTNTINLVKGASLRSVADVNLLSEAGNVTTVGYGYAQDIYRKTLEEIASAFSNLFGGSDVSFATEYHSSASPVGKTAVIVDGSVETGIQNKQYLLIDAIKEGNISNYTINESTGNGQVIFAVKTTSTEGISYTITKENLATNLIEYRKKLVNLKNEYAADQKAVAAYTGDIAYVDSQLETMGLIITDGKGVKVPIESYEVYYLTLNDVQARGGNINVTAGKLTGSGSLQAPKDSAISIINNSPLYLRTNQLLLDDAGGHVNLNGVEVASALEITQRNQGNATAKLQVSLPRGESVVSVTPTVNTITISSKNGVDSFDVIKTDNKPTTTKIAATNKPAIDLQNTYTSALYSGVNLNKLFASAPNIQISDSISNSAGSVNIYNAEGSILLQGENGSSPNITANEIHINATNGSVYQSYTPGLTSIGGDPESLWTQTISGLESTSNKKASSTYSNIVNGNGGIYANGGVFISGQYLNVNGTIQSGVADWSLALNGSTKYSGTGTSTLDQFISAKQAEWVKLGKDPNTKYQISLGSAETGTIASYYNPSTRQIELDGVTVQGGRVELYGQIMNTGGGSINALDGYGNINITNNTKYDLVVNNLDTGNNIHGVVKITDTGKVKTVSGQEHYLITQYERNTTGQVQTTTSHTGLNDAVTKVSSGSTRSVNGGYSPVAGTRYVWTLGQDKTTTITEKFDHKVGMWGWDPLGWVTSDKDKTSSNTVTSNLTPLPGGTYAVVDASNSSAGLLRTYKTNLLSKTSSDSKSSYKSGFLSWYKHYVTDRVTKEGYTDVYTYSAKADYAIGVGFGGYDAGANAGITVSGTGNSGIIINNSLTNRGGAVTVKAANRGIASANTDAVISAKAINLSAGGLYSDIGTTAAPIAVKLLGDSGALTATTVAGDINLKGVSGDLRLINVDTYANSGGTKYGTVKIDADGSIVQATAGNAAVIRGNSINLTSDTGSIGTTSQALNVSVMGTSDTDSINATAAKDISLRQPNGDFRLGHIESLGGDVTIEAVNGSLVDGNPVESIDTRTLDEMNALWDRMQVKQGTGTDAANNQTLVAYANGKQAAYSDYWRMRHVTAVYDAQGNVIRYTADAYNPNYTYTATDSDKTMFTQAEMTVAQQQQYIDQKTQTYLSVGKELGSRVAYNPNYTYIINDTDRANLTTKGWTDSQLKYSIDLGIAKQTVSTDTSLQDPNVIGRQVTLLAKKGGIGMDNGEIVINPNDRNVLKDIYNADGTVTPSAARLALASAEGDDITIDSKNQIHVSLRKAIYAKSDTLEAIGKDHVYIGSASPIYVKSIQSGTGINGIYDGTVRIKGKAGLYDVSTSDKAALQGVNGGNYLVSEDAALKGGRTVIEAGYNGSLGTKDAPFSVKLANGSALTARAAGNIYIDSLSNNLYLAEVYSEGDVWLHASGSILTNTNSNINSVATQGKTITFSSDAGTLGTADKALLVNADDLVVSGKSAVLEGQIDNSIRLNTNKVTLRNVYSKGAQPLEVTLAGYGKAMADLANITVSAPKGVIFNSLNVDNATIKASANELSLSNTIIGTLASFSNNYYTTIAGNNLSSSQWGDASLVLATQNNPFNLLMSGNKADTNASILKSTSNITKVGAAVSKENNVGNVVSKAMNTKVEKKVTNASQEGITPANVTSPAAPLMDYSGSGKGIGSTENLMQLGTPKDNPKDTPKDTATKKSATDKEEEDKKDQAK